MYGLAGVPLLLAEVLQRDGGDAVQQARLRELLRARRRVLGGQVSLADVEVGASFDGGVQDLDAVLLEQLF